jgi:hypothetical protein
VQAEGCLLAATELDQTGLTAASFRSCACADDINNVAKLASLTSFIGFPYVGSIRAGSPTSLRRALALLGQSAWVLIADTPRGGQTPSGRLLRDLARGKRRIVKILAVLAADQGTNKLLKGNAMHAPNPTR